MTMDNIDSIYPRLLSIPEYKKADAELTDIIAKRMSELNTCKRTIKNTVIKND